MTQIWNRPDILVWKPYAKFIPVAWCVLLLSCSKNAHRQAASWQLMQICNFGVKAIYQICSCRARFWMTDVIHIEKNITSSYKTIHDYWKLVPPLTVGNALSTWTSRPCSRTRQCSIILFVQIIFIYIIHCLSYKYSI